MVNQTPSLVILIIGSRAHLVLPMNFNGTSRSPLEGRVSALFLDFLALLGSKELLTVGGGIDGEFQLALLWAFMS